MRRWQTTKKGRGFCGWVKLEQKGEVVAEVNKAHEKGEIYNLDEAVVK